MNYYIMHDTQTESGESVEPRVLAKTASYIEATMLVEVLEPQRRSTATGSRVYLVAEKWLDHEHLNRAAAAAFEVDGPDPKDGAEIAIIQGILARTEDEGDLRRQMVQRLLVEDEGHDHMWKRKLLEWIMWAPHKPGDDENALGTGGDMDVFERLLAESKAEEEGWFEQMRDARAEGEAVEA